MDRQYILGNEICFDILKHEIITFDQTFSMGSREAAILKILYDNRNRTITKEEFNEQVWGKLWVSETSLTKAISNLRKTLQSLDGIYCKIKTMPKEGYMLIMDNENDHSDQEEKSEIPTIDNNSIIEIQDITTRLSDDCLQKPSSGLYQRVLFMIMTALLTSLMTTALSLLLK